MKKIIIFTLLLLLTTLPSTAKGIKTHMMDAAWWCIAVLFLQ